MGAVESTENFFRIFNDIEHDVYFTIESTYFNDSITCFNLNNGEISCEVGRRRIGTDLKLNMFVNGYSAEPTVFVVLYYN